MVSDNEPISFSKLTEGSSALDDVTNSFIEAQVELSEKKHYFLYWTLNTVKAVEKIHDNIVKYYTVPLFTPQFANLSE